MNGNGVRNGVNIGTLATIASVVISVIAGTWILANKVNNTKTDILSSNLTMKTEFTAKATALEARIVALEARPTKETWSDGDMFRWATRLQRENQNLRVPEPPMKSDTLPSR
jgi:hypothetical protein